LFRKKNMKNNRGYSLLEMMLVIAIIGIITSLSVVKYKDTVANDRLKIEANNLYMELRGTKAVGLKYDGEVIIRFKAAELCSIYVDTGDTNHLMPFKTYKMNPPVKLGVAANGPLDGPSGLAIAPSGITSTWNPQLKWRDRNVCSFEKGALYIQNPALKKITYCICSVPDSVVFLQLYKWDGSSWIKI
jgi:prepilin-type N-terminal cleavage/methylation domain-containing protein